MRAVALGAVICLIGACGDGVFDAPGYSVGAPGVDPASISPAKPVAGGGGCAGGECAEPAGEEPCAGCGGGEGGTPGWLPDAWTDEADAGGPGEPPGEPGEAPGEPGSPDPRTGGEGSAPPGGGSGGRGGGAAPDDPGAPADPGVSDPGNAPCEGAGCGDDPECAGDPGPCPFGPADFGPAFRVTRLRVAATGKKGHGFDLDPEHGPDDCAPKGHCAAGVDNALAPLGHAVNVAMVADVESGVTVWLGELHAGPGPLAVRFHMGDGPTACNDGVCSYVSAADAWGCDCEIRSRLSDAVIEGSELTAGAPGDVLLLPLTLAPDLHVTLPLHAPRLRATVSLQGGVHLTKGLLGGAVLKADLVAAVLGAGDPVVEQAVLAITSVIAPDIDLDGNGVPESLSIGLHIAGEPATIGGVE